MGIKIGLIVGAVVVFLVIFGIWLYSAIDRNDKSTNKHGKGGVLNV